MRKIEKQMCAAIRNKRNFALKNTDVVQNDDKAFVYLHNNLIAVCDYRKRNFMLTLAGWNTVTTRSRLNALCDEFMLGGGFSQRNYGAYFNGEEIDPSDSFTVDWEGAIEWN